MSAAVKLLIAAAAVLSISRLAAAQAPTGEPVAAIPLVQNWVGFTDPQEGAFRVEVPQNWNNSGGTARRNALQYRNWVSAISPDGETIVALNDPTEGAYIAPSPLLAMAGLRVGSLYNGGGDLVYTVAPTQSGQQFAVSWGLRKLASLCPGARVTGSRARPDIAQRINAYSRPFGIIHDAGEAAFACNRGGLPMTAYVVASMTYLGQTGIWYADGIGAFLAPAPVAGVAAGVLAHMIATLSFNPAWLAHVSNNAAAVARAAAQDNAAISDAIMQGWQTRGAALDRVMAEDSRARLGIDVYADPSTGTRYTVANGHQYYWVNPRGTVVGTDTDTAPDGFRRLDRVRP
jgi:hypothetical protein